MCFLNVCHWPSTTVNMFRLYRFRRRLSVPEKMYFAVERKTGSVIINASRSNHTVFCPCCPPARGIFKRIFLLSAPRTTLVVVCDFAHCSEDSLSVVITHLLGNDEKSRWLTKYRGFPALRSPCEFKKQILHLGHGASPAFAAWGRGWHPRPMKDRCYNFNWFGHIAAQFNAFRK